MKGEFHYMKIRVHPDPGFFSRVGSGFLRRSGPEPGKTQPDPPSPARNGLVVRVNICRGNYTQCPKSLIHFYTGSMIWTRDKSSLAYSIPTFIIIGTFFIQIFEWFSPKWHCFGIDPKIRIRPSKQIRIHSRTLSLLFFFHLSGYDSSFLSYSDNF